MPDPSREGPIHLPVVGVTIVNQVGHLFVIRESGPEELIEVRAAGKKSAMRFAVGEPGFRGTIWRVWANRRTDDVYIASRGSAGEVKVSLHQSGDWRLAMVDPSRPGSVIVRTTGESAQGRVLDQWRRPSANLVGWTHALSLLLPQHHLARVPGEATVPGAVRWLLAPGPNEQVDFEVHVVTPQQGVMSYAELVDAGGRVAVMDAFQLPGGDVVVVLAITHRTTVEDDERITSCEVLAESLGEVGGAFDTSPVLGPRRMVFGVDPDGRRVFYDLSMRGRTA